MVLQVTEALRRRKLHQAPARAIHRPPSSPAGDATMLKYGEGAISSADKAATGNAGELVALAQHKNPEGRVRWLGACISN